MKKEQIEILNQYSHRRYNPLLDEWVLVAPHRTKRPWQGSQDDEEEEIAVDYDESCFLCPGNSRSSKEINPNYEDTFIFYNDFPALMENAEIHSFREDPLFQGETVRGTGKVICYSPSHSLTLPELPVESIEKLINSWVNELDELSKSYKWVQVFENKGQMMGCSQPHPHGQIWASEFIPTQINKKDSSQREFFNKYKKNLLLDYVTKELEFKERIVHENEHWVVLIPYWAAWPFETMVLPKKHIPQMSYMNLEQRKCLASILKKLTVSYDNLFNCSFPYSMGWHFAPFVDTINHLEYWQLHATFLPPLLRSKSIRKFMVGYELLCEQGRDITPEVAAAYLGNTSVNHYKARK